MDVVNEPRNAPEQISPTYDEVPRSDTEDRREQRRKIPNLHSGFIMNNISHILMFLFTLYLLVLSFSNYSLFSWHPSLMTTGFMLLMGEAVMAVSSDNLLTSRLSRRSRVRAHWLLQACAAACIFGGFVVIVINKNLGGKLHFQTLHGIMGLISVILVGITSSGGVLTLYTVRLKNSIKPAKLKLTHNVFGVITFLFGIITIILGLYSKWFAKNSNSAVQAIAVLVAVLSAVFALENAVKSAYYRARAIMQPN